MNHKGHEASSLISKMKKSRSLHDGRPVNGSGGSRRTKQPDWGRSSLGPPPTGSANATWGVPPKVGEGGGAGRVSLLGPSTLLGVPEAVHCCVSSSSTDAPRSPNANPAEELNDVSKPEEKQHQKKKKKHRKKGRRSKIYDDPAVVEGYASVPVLDVDRLPRGGISIETQAVGRIQFGIPPETIKDSMRLGLGVPSVYIVPVERFCREIGPALGINLAEFEFPAYFNYFVRQKRCTLVVDSVDAEQNIRTVFGETLLGPEQFRDHDNPTPNEEEDFDPSFPKEARPNFYKEFYHFRTAEESSNYEELTIDMLLDFCRFEESKQSTGSDSSNRHLGVPPIPEAYHTSEEEPEEDLPVERHSYTVSSAVLQTNGHCSQNTVHFAEKVQMSDEEEHQPIKRSLSDPDMRKLSIDDMMPPAPSLSPDIDAAMQQVEDSHKKMLRRGSMESTGSFMSRETRSRGGMSWSTGASFMMTDDDEEYSGKKPWIYSQAKWLGDVATVFPHSATEEQKKTLSTPRVEIFKMTGGTEYIIHDIDENNVIIGKARFSGTVRVPDEMAVEGFMAAEDFTVTDAAEDALGTEFSEEEESRVDAEDVDADDMTGPISCAPSQDIEFDLGARPSAPPTFHPPSFGVTVLGNSHGFDKNGSTSGYVLWINGRGVMIDPPPYSSATLEREGIRPQMIVAIIITHTHADHDAGTFQKVMTGSRVAIITTPTIYRSFIRKYAALSGLSPTLLRHSHRHRPAIIGQPLKFQGATFHFTYTLHTIPCIGFKVEWRGRSMVFTGDHLNSPPMIAGLEKSNVITKERADDLRRLPLQDCDALLHEAGAPPIHTPLSVLKELPEEVKSRLYVVHTSALPPDCDLRVAPTGTAGTIRLDELNADNKASPSVKPVAVNGTHGQDTGLIDGEDLYIAKAKSVFGMDPASLDDGGYPNLTVHGDYMAPSLPVLDEQMENGKVPPLVFLRPTCVSDAWFILNLLSAVPFLSSLSYANTMEVLEIAQVEMFCADEIVIPAHRRSEALCVVWEGACVERDSSVQAGTTSFEYCDDASDYEDNLDSQLELDMFDFADANDGMLRRFNRTVWYAGDWTGPVALQPDMERSAETPFGEAPKDIVALSAEGVKVIMLNIKDLYQILKKGSKLFRKYQALKQKQAAEEAVVKAEMMRMEMNGSDSHNQSDSVSESGPDDWFAYDSVLEVLKCNSALARLTAHQKRHLESLAEGPRIFDPGEYLWHVGQPVNYAFLIVAGTAVFTSKSDQERRQSNRRGSTESSFSRSQRSYASNVEEDKQLFNIPPNSEYARLEIGLQLRVEEMEMDVYEQTEIIEAGEERARSARDRFANKVLARLYSRRAYTAGLVFSRGNLLSDTSRMVNGNLSHIHSGRQKSKRSMGLGAAADDHHWHTSNMAAGPEGCRVMVFPRHSLVQFLDGNPGVLLSLLGTQVVV